MGAGRCELGCTRHDGPGALSRPQRNRNYRQEHPPESRCHQYPADLDKDSVRAFERPAKGRVPQGVNGKPDKDNKEESSPRTV